MAYKLKFIPGKGPQGSGMAAGDHCGVIELADGSQIVLSPSDPKRRRDFRRRYKEGKPGLPTIDTRNELGRLFVASPDMLKALQRLTHPMADDDDVDFARSVIAKATGE